MTYFTNCKTQEDLKKEYRRLCKELHPDNGGNAADFQKMQADFETAGRSEAWRTFKNAKGETYTKDTTETAADFMEVLNKLAGLDGLTLEICGTWLWITGNTYPVRDILKSAGCKFSKKKTAWYWHKEPYRKRSKRELNMMQIREMFGSEEVETIKREKIA